MGATDSGTPAQFFLVDSLRRAEEDMLPMIFQIQCTWYPLPGRSACCHSIIGFLPHKLFKFPLQSFQILL